MDNLDMRIEFLGVENVELLLELEMSRIVENEEEF